MKRLAPLLSLLAGCHLLMDPDSVPPPAPSGLTYSSEAMTYVVDHPIAANRPLSGGGPVSSYAILPPLPEGLAFDPVTGIISGTPTQPSFPTSYAVTASNAGGAAMVDLRIEVKIGDLTAQSGSFSKGCAISSGAAWCWEFDTLVPTRMAGLTAGVQWISGSRSQGCAVVSGGAWCWGDNTDGQLGNGTTTASSVPVPVAGLAAGVQAIETYWDHACAIVNGGVQCWGNIEATRSLAPVQIPGLLSGVQALATGETINCALRNGGVECFNLTGSSPVAGLSGVTALATGGSHSCALVTGAVKCWGWNSYGQLGDGSLTDRSSPVQVTGLTEGVQAIAAGRDFTCAAAGGGVQCWGNGADSQLGSGPTGQSLVPTPVPDLASGVQAVRTHVYGTCALVNGGLQCWGLDRHFPAAVAGFGP